MYTVHVGPSYSPWHTCFRISGNGEK